LGDNPDFQAAIREVELSMTPLSIPRIEEALAELDTITSKRKADEVDLAMTMQSYTERLAFYPSDVVQYVIDEWSSKWWPTWSELKDELEKHTSPRRDLLFQIEKASREFEAAEIASSEQTRQGGEELTSEEIKEHEDNLKHFGLTTKSSPDSGDEVE